MLSATRLEGPASWCGLVALVTDSVSTRRLRQRATKVIVFFWSAPRSTRIFYFEFPREAVFNGQPAQAALKLDTAAASVLNALMASFMMGWYVVPGFS